MRQAGNGGNSKQQLVPASPYIRAPESRSSFTSSRSLPFTWLANQKDNHCDCQQTHRSNQNVVAPTGNQSKHAQSPSNLKMMQPGSGYSSMAGSMGATLYSSTPALATFDVKRLIVSPELEYLVSGRPRWAKGQSRIHSSRGRLNSSSFEHDEA
jgi:hypothetical protein